MSRPQTVASIPHSWSLEDWPAAVYPGSATKARYIIRAHRDDLIHEGALARVGRVLVVFGGRYARWLEKRAADVPGYVPAANRQREALKEQSA